MSEIRAELPTVAALVMLMLMTISVTGCFRESRDIAVYSVMCLTRHPDGSCRLETALGKTVYRVSQENQSVLYWYGDSLPNALKDCVVRDEKNWQCQYSDDSAHLSMNDGHFSIMLLVDYPLSEDVEYVSRWEYWRVSVKEMIPGLSF